MSTVSRTPFRFMLVHREVTNVHAGLLPPFLSCWSPPTTAITTVGSLLSPRRESETIHSEARFE